MMCGFFILVLFSLSIPINQKKYTLVAGQALTINLPQPFKISDWESAKEKKKSEEGKGFIRITKYFYVAG